MLSTAPVNNALSCIAQVLQLSQIILNQVDSHFETEQASLLLTQAFNFSILSFTFLIQQLIAFLLPLP